VPSPPPDGTLLPWTDVEAAHQWEVLLLGNGLSINVWPSFAYSRLFDYARGGGLTRGDLRLFNDNPNFEAVLGELATAIRVAEAIRYSAAPFYERYRRVQMALGHAVRQVHCHRTQVSNATLSTIREQLLKYEWIFTTSYDLIVYWAMGYGERFAPFIDHFRYGGKLAFDPARAEVYVGRVPVYFLHGALHLAVGGDGVTFKIRRNLLTLLEQFGDPIPGDLQARPLLVTEGSAREKLRAIEGNDYLAHSLGRLRERERPVLVFGSSLGDQDRHLVDALNVNPNRAVAVSMRPGPKRELRSRQAELYGRLDADPLLFFDATTHPRLEDRRRQPDALGRPERPDRGLPDRGRPPRLRGEDAARGALRRDRLLRPLARLRLPRPQPAAALLGAPAPGLHRPQRRHGRTEEVRRRRPPDRARPLQRWRAYQQDGDRARLQAQIAPLQAKLRALLEHEARKSPRTKYHRLFAKSLLKRWTALWTFAHTDGVEPTNNPAERGLGGAVIYRKLSLGSQAEQGERTIERLLSASITCRLQRRSLFAYLTDVLTANIRGDPIPALA
jgi:hypothetical protein